MIVVGGQPHQLKHALHVQDFLTFAGQLHIIAAELNKLELWQIMRL